jgi:hypothetical protein
MDSDMRTEEQIERTAGTFVRWGCIALLGAGVVHAIIILVTGRYDFVEYGIQARLEGWEARIAAGLQLTMCALLAVSTHRSKDFDPK